MHWQYTPYTLPLAVAATVSAALAVYAWRRRPTPGTIPFAVLMLAVAEWTLAYAFELGGLDRPTIVLGLKAEYPGIVTVPVAWLVLVLQYTGRDKWLTRRTLALLTVIPLATLLLAWTNETHGLIWRHIELKSAGPVLAPVFSRGPWYWVNVGYGYSLVLLGILLLIQMLVRSPAVYRRQASVLLVGAIVPWVGDVLWVFDLNPFAYLDPTPFAFTASGLVVAWGLFRYRLLDVVPVAHETVIESMSDGVIVLDAQNRIVDLNPAAERIIGHTATEAIGQPLDISDGSTGLTTGFGLRTLRLGSGQVSDWNAWSAKSEFRNPKSEMVYDLRISPLRDRRGDLTGRLILLRDITERVQAEETLKENEARLRTVTESALAGVYIIQDGKFTYVNPAVADIFGYTPDEVVGKLGPTDLTHPDDRSTVAEYVRRRLEGEEESVHYTFRGLRKDGNVIYCEVLGRRVEYQGRSAIIGTLLDITERKRAEEEKRQRQERIRRQHEALIRLSTYPALAQGRLDEALPTLTEAAASALDMERVNVWRLSPDGGQFRCLEAFERSSDEHTAGQVLQSEDYPQYFAALETGLVVDATDVATDSRTAELTADYWDPLGISSCLDAPIRLHGEVVGTVCHEHVGAPRPWRSDEITFARQIADLVAQAFLNADIRRRTTELEALRRVSLSLTSSLELEEVLNAILEGVLKLLTGVEDTHIFLYRDEEDHLTFGAAQWAASYEGQPIAEPRPGGFTHTVARKGESMVVPDVRTSPLFTNAYPDWEGAIVGVPLKIGQRVVGVMNIAYPEPHDFPEAELRVLRLLGDQAAVAIENARLFEAEKAARRRAETLQEVAAALNATLDLGELLDLVLEELQQVVPYDSASVQLLRDGHTEIVGGRGWEDPTTVLGLRFHVPSDNPNTVVIEERRPYILNDAPAAHAPFREDPHSHIRSWLGVPLIVRDRVVGMLTVDSTEPNHFSQDHARLAAVFADHVAIALENARLFEAEQQRREIAAALLDIAQVASSSLEPEQVLIRIARRTAEACQANRCTIFLLDDEGEYLQPVMSQFADGHVDYEMWEIFKATTADRVDAVPLFRDAIRERRPALLEDPARTDLIPRKWTQPFGIRKLLAVPLMSHDRAIGLMALDHSDASHEFTPEQIDLALTIGGQVAASIKNAQLYTKMQQLAITDSLTGLYNRRGFFELGRREVDRAKRFGRPLAAIMIDIDRFKRVNDRYGHAVGDQVLAQLADRWQQQLREVDVVGRYGGEEFAVLLPETDLTEARQVAERLRRDVEHTAIDTDEGPVTVTISLGVTVLDGESDDLEDLLRSADQALYAAKQAGRNRVAVSQS